jgi:Pentatricopeptide repeat domain
MSGSTCRNLVLNQICMHTPLWSQCTSKRNHDAVHSVLREMVVAGIELTVATYNAIISSCVKSQTGAAALSGFPE